MYSRYREPRLPQEPLSQDQFHFNFLRILPDASEEDAERAWILFKAVGQQRFGSMIIVAEDAAAESERLSQQGTAVDPVPMTPELLERVSGIDGSVILDTQGICYAIGVILDGIAAPECTPARGSRFNSALRYVRTSAGRRMAIVVSHDRTVDVIPMLRPQIAKSEVEKQIAELERATLENYHMSRLWLDDHRFYLNREQCDRVNRALEQLESLPKTVGQLVIVTRRLEPHPELDDTFFLRE